MKGFMYLFFGLNASSLALNTMIGNTNLAVLNATATIIIWVGICTTNFDKDKK